MPSPIPWRRALGAALVLWPLAAWSAPAAAEPRLPYLERADVQRFVAETARALDLDADWIERQLRPARHVGAVTRLIMPTPPGTAKDWSAYRARFVEPQRIGAGVAFWRDHAATLARAETQFGVPAAVIVGIVGVETFYGRITGNFRTVDALATLAFDFPSGRSDRSAYFRDELAQLLAWVAHEDIDASSVRGSFAGAIGLPQFMPSSIRRWALDYDGDGHVDLRGSAADAIGSVANFLAGHGWQRGLPTHYAVTPPAERVDRATLLAPDIVPSFSAAQFAERGATLDDAGRAHDGLLALVEVDNGSAPPSHVAGTHNFFVLTRYNRSSYYALAVLELGAAVEAAHRATRQAAH
ncbi:MAG: lytic murein transglycosylase B [Gammaproteobacteria bacterium]|uniref:lytic murein transglycosylase B n=1 Tax=Azohydromonas sp. TaxID=1872666 RepID=UPI002CA6B0F5|nr:lytic murein transglycosylase B [Azohydromonas sp.]HMM84075.1 lytic murein transglycosylase B [Azohydromonas sp.]